MISATLQNVMIASHLHKRLLEFLSTVSRPLIVVLGPTASGKTAFSIELAHIIPDAEIINADSRQLYKFLDIGTAKITRADMQGVPHHLLDVLDPKEEATAAWYKREAEKIIEDVHAREHVPILVGGSMLYISAVIDGLEFVSASDPVLRKRLEDVYDSDDGASLYQRLLELDPDTAIEFSVKNKPYVVRAMEIYERTGSKPSDARRQSNCPYDLFIIGIERPRDAITRRINARTAELFRNGWTEEVQGLLTRGYTANDPAMKSHGYREIIEWLPRSHGSSESIPSGAEGLTMTFSVSSRAVSRDDTLQELQETISAKTRQYAKRQQTWWKHDDRITWVNFE